MTGSATARPEQAKGLTTRLFERPFVLALVLLTMGAGLIRGGWQLLSLGGSPYYAVAGLAVLACGVLVFLRRRAAMTLYGLLLLGTVVWALAESGFDAWALAPRLGLLGGVGCWFLMPWVRRRLVGKPRMGARGAIVATLAALLAGSGLHMMTPGPADPIFQAGVQAAPRIIGQTETIPLPAAGKDWPVWGGTQEGTRYSSLDQLDPRTVSRLQLVWTYRFGPTPPGAPRSLEATPLKIGGQLFLCSDYSDVVSLDAETGKEIWRWRARARLEGVPYAHCRGVAYYATPEKGGICARRIIAGTVDARLVALDAATGRPCPGFGTGGAVDLLRGMPKAPPGYYLPTAAPLISHGKVVVGGWVSDGQYWGEPSGVIRAFDAVSGKLAWAFDIGRPDRTGEPPAGETYTPGTPNAWAPLSADDRLGLVYAPLGGASLDYTTHQRRPFDNEWSGSIVAIDVETGKPHWKFQTVHKDMWDYDVPAQPTLIDVRGPEGFVRALVQPTKRGEVFVLDRATGRPVVPVTERPSPVAGAAPGEVPAPTQPFSDAMPSFRGADVTERQMWGLTPFDQMWCRIQFRKARYHGPLTPPGLTPALVSPGFLGGSNWGGVTIDPVRRLAVFNTNHVANLMQLLPRSAVDAMGVRPAGLGGKLKPEGQGVLPQAGTRYGVRPAPFLSPLVVPCQQPPWGRISAVDLDTRKLVWTHPIGTARDSGPLGLSSMLPFRIGTPNLGGSVMTKGGLTFIGATQDHFLRAYDSATGEVVWRGRLGAGPQATPMTYLSEKSGRQFVVIVAGGHAFLGTSPGDTVYAFALPDKPGTR